ncbi:hypothetical protein ACD661_05025 [Legionella lytica]|uniref:Secreted protein n=1 Tax=Legionella lytica TaxID=96232 RepID=A0ABW8D5E8_9GAMM
MNKLALVSSACFSLSLLTGCASIVSGNQQKITVLTPPVENARCALENNKGKWYVDHTPNSIVVHRSNKDLVLTCEKPGYEKSSTQVQSKLKGLIFGNIIFGGVIGGGIDVATGSAFDYPKEIKVPMKPSARKKK